jgi:hypothetical protein
MKEYLMSIFMYFFVNDDWNINISNSTIFFVKNKQNISVQDNQIFRCIQQLYM